MSSPTKDTERAPQSAAAPSPFPPIAEYAFLSNCHTGALIAPDGAVDWLCAPSFDSPSMFGSLLDRQAGSFRLGPYGITHPTARVYEAGTNVFETTWKTPAGWIVVAVTEALHRSAAWCLLFNGIHVRIVDATRLYARRHLQFDLDLAMGTRAGLAALWQTIAAHALAADPSDPGSLRAFVDASDRHAAGVCKSLRSGVLDASADVLRALVGRGLCRAAGRRRGHGPR